MSAIAARLAQEAAGAPPAMPVAHVKVAAELKNIELYVAKGAWTADAKRQIGNRLVAIGQQLADAE